MRLVRQPGILQLRRFRCRRPKAPRNAGFCEAGDRRRVSARLFAGILRRGLQWRFWNLRNFVRAAPRLIGFPRFWRVSRTQRLLADGGDANQRDRDAYGL